MRFCLPFFECGINLEHNFILLQFKRIRCVFERTRRIGHVGNASFKSGNRTVSASNPSLRVMIRIAVVHIADCHRLFDAFFIVAQLENRFLCEHLLDVPIGIAERQIHDANIFADTCHLLRKPKRECIVIAIRKENCIRTAAVEKIICIIPRHPNSRTVMFCIIRDARNDRANHDKGNRHRGCKNRSVCSEQIDENADAYAKD